MNGTKDSVDIGPIILGTVMTAAFGIVALLGLAIWVYYSTLPPSPYPMDLPEGALFFAVFCPAISCALFILALFIGIKTFDAYKARKANAGVPAQQTGEGPSESTEGP